ncbi:MAG: permease [Prolixibacteraceae bacterium]|nr:permease [Prolixibacteraceae bacterium]
MEQIYYILNFILKSFIHVWPYLLVTIPLAVWMNMSDYSKHFKKVMTKSPWLSIILATVVGAFSPFCSCGVIPVISALLIGGVPLAPVFAFWVASPSMDPEIFFLSVSVLGWELAVWRLVSTFALSLMAGAVAHFLVKSGYITTFIRSKESKIERPKAQISLQPEFMKAQDYLAFQKKETVGLQISGMAVTCCAQKAEPVTTCSCSSTNEPANEKTFRQRLINESLKSVWMITKFMGLAFLLNALINLYVPQEWIGQLLNQQGFASVIIAAALGVPVYTSNITALPMVGGLLQLGLHPGAALAFLISGPLTTIPAMAAVYGITTRKVFGLYVAFSLFGSLLFGLLYYFLA